MRRIQYGAEARGGGTIGGREVRDAGIRRLRTLRWDDVNEYSLIHLERAAVTRAVAEMARVLIPGGLLLLAFHGGEGEVHAEDWFGCGVSIDATLFQPAEMAASMVRAGFDVEEVVTREPYDFEYPSQRVYARGTKRP
jgi:SAM-dependent methyltransferase